MKLSLSQPQLAATIARGSAAAAKKSPLQILTHLRLTAWDEGGIGLLALASCDHERFAEAVATGEVETPGAACVDADTFKTLIAKYPKSGTVTIELVGTQLIVSCGRSRVKMPTLDPETFPTWADGDPAATFRLNSEDFNRAFKRVRFAASDSIAKPHMQGVHLDFHDGRLHFAATDGNRLAVSGMVAPDGAETCPNVIVPSEAVDAALAVFSAAVAIDVTVNDRAIGLSADGLRLSARLIDGTFPDYPAFIPARGHPGLRVKRADFVDCLERANLMLGAGALSAVVARPVARELLLEARNEKGGEAVEALPACAVADNGDLDMEPFGFNSRYVSAFLGTLNVDELALEHAGGMAPILIYADDAPDFVGMLGPMAVAL